jgi:hypothetical protein
MFDCGDEVYGVVGWSEGEGGWDGAILVMDRMIPGIMNAI